MLPSERVELWRAAVEAGLAAAVCDRIVATRPVPPKLLVALALTDAPAGLSRRQAEILRLLGQGHTERTAAAALGIGYETARSHTKRARLQLRVRTNTQAYAVAWRRGLL